MAQKVTTFAGSVQKWEKSGVGRHIAQPPGPPRPPWQWICITQFFFETLVGPSVDRLICEKVSQQENNFLANSRWSIGLSVRR